MSRQRGVALERYLNTTASSPFYSQSLDSYMFNTYKTPPGVDKIRFFIQSVDIEGKAQVYTYQEQSILGIVLFINPDTINNNYAKLISRSQTMTGWVEEHWGEELDTITFAGSSAAFIWGGPTEVLPGPGPLDLTVEETRNIFNQYMNIPDLGTNEPVGIGDHSGLTVKRRRNTLSYDEFRKLTFLMNGNGMNYDIYGLAKERKYIQLAYDQASFRGYFESMDITESAESPYRFTYTITFKSEKTIYNYLG